MEDLNQRIEDTLNSIDGLQKAEVPAFFYTRVHARLERKLAMPQNTWMPVRKPVWVIGILTVLLVANVFLIASPSNKVSIEAAETSNLQGFASSYGLTTSSGY